MLEYWSIGESESPSPSLHYSILQFRPLVVYTETLSSITILIVVYRSVPQLVDFIIVKSKVVGDLVEHGGANLLA